MKKRWEEKEVKSQRLKEEKNQVVTEVNGKALAKIPGASSDLGTEK